MDDCGMHHPSTSAMSNIHVLHVKTVALHFCMTRRLVKQEDTVELGKYCGNGINRVFKLEFSMRTIPIALMLNSTSEESKPWVIPFWEVCLV
jgi:hypothetical protein